MESKVVRRLVPVVGDSTSCIHCTWLRLSVMGDGSGLIHSSVVVPSPVLLVPRSKLQSDGQTCFPDLTRSSLLALAQILALI